MIDNYFQLRNVTPSKYDNFQVPFYIKRYLKSDDTILDFGCGFGQLIIALKNLNLDNVYGYDINREAEDYCKSKNINIFKSLSDISIKFDVIIMSHVLEHIKKDEIIETLKYIRENLLKPQGKLFIIVPNAQANTGSYWRYEDWTHEILFTSGSIFFVAKAAGFDRIEFLDIDNTENLKLPKKIVKKFFLKIYKIKIRFWNKITSSAFHSESPNIFSFEIKVLATNK